MCPIGERELRPAQTALNFNAIGTELLVSYKPLAHGSLEAFISAPAASLLIILEGHMLTLCNKPARTSDSTPIGCVPK